MCTLLVMNIFAGRNSPASAWPNRNAPENPGCVNQGAPRETRIASTFCVVPSAVTNGVRSTMNGKKPTTCEAWALPATALIPGSSVPLA